MGLPESYKTADLLQIWRDDIFKALRLPKQCVVERAHCLGICQADTRGPRQVIVKYLNYSDKAAILQKFSSKKYLQIEGSELPIFADYSVELTRKRKLFSKFCMELHHNCVKFTLAYPAVLSLQTPDGNQRSL